MHNPLQSTAHAAHCDGLRHHSGLSGALFETVRNLHASGKTVSSIVKEAGIGKKRISAWVGLTELPERNRMEPNPRTPAFYQDYLAKRWAEATDSGIYGMQRFVRTLKQDLSAVEAAVEQTWSNGPVEGHINKLKIIKRQMYGRAGFELLRARILPLPPSPSLHQE